MESLIEKDKANKKALETDLSLLAKPLRDYLAKNYDMHTVAIVEWDKVTIFQGLKSDIFKLTKEESN